jgi:glutathione S-transferase
MSTDIVLVSHALCPYVQRVAIVLAEKAVCFERRDVDLSRKPDWFLAVSPLGKTPLLLVEGRPIFESAVICEYLDETRAPRLHSEDALARARDRAWVEFASSLLNTICAFYSAADDGQLEARAGEIRGRFAQVESELGKGTWFGGGRFGLVDAAFAPVFRYFEVFERIDDFGFLAGLPRARAWRRRLAARASVRDAVAKDYPDRLLAFLAARRSALSRRIEASTRLSASA